MGRSPSVSGGDEVSGSNRKDAGGFGGLDMDKFPKDSDLTQDSTEFSEDASSEDSEDNVEYYEEETEFEGPVPPFLYGGRVPPPFPAQPFGPPPPYGAVPIRPPFPPPFVPNGNLPPIEDEVEYEYYIEDGENEELDMQYEEDSVEDEKNRVVPSFGVAEKKGIDALKVPEKGGEELKHLQENGEERARELEGVEKVSSIFLRVLKYALNTVVILILLFICFVLVHFSINRTPKNENSPSAVAMGSPSAKDLKWRLLFSRANSVAKSFYESVGTLDGFANVRNMAMRGAITFAGTKGESSSPFYCIKKRDGTAFLKIGAGGDAKCFYIDERGKVESLSGGGMSGERKAVSGEQGELLRSTTVFDDVLNQCAFPLDGGSDSILDSSIKYEGVKNFRESMHECISVEDLSGRKTKFYVSPSTNFISGIEIGGVGPEITVMFDDYGMAEQNFKLPMKRSVFLNGKLYATVKLDTVVINREIIFPQ